MTEFFTLAGIVTAFLAIVAGMLWGIAAMTGGAGPQERRRR